jgi:uncharacterized protein
MNGDVMGISGILAVLQNPLQSMKRAEDHWKLVYLASFLFTVNALVQALSLKDDRLERGDVPNSSFLAHVLGGFLVGVGTKLGNGCTTGHGVCGMGRFSPRSFLAVLTFTGCGIATAVLTSPNNAAWAEATRFLRQADGTTLVSKPLGTLFTMAGLSLAVLRRSETTKIIHESVQRKMYGAAASGMIFALGLAISGMIYKSKVQGFLDVSALSKGNYDPTLITVLGSAVLISSVGYQIQKRFQNGPTCGAGCWNVPTSTKVDHQLVTGAAIFGIGWGIAGLCPGPALFCAAAGSVYVLAGWMPAFVAGSYIGLKLKEYLNSPPKSKTL